MADQTGVPPNPLETLMASVARIEQQMAALAARQQELDEQRRNEQPNNNNNQRLVIGGNNQRQAQRNNHQEEQRQRDLFSKPKIVVPKFDGKTDPDAYVDWELKVDLLFSTFPCENPRDQVYMVTCEFTEYALQW